MVNARNIHEGEYEIEIPARFSLYNDIYENNPSSATTNTRFKVTGILATPQDGRVYYTSDKELFKSGDAKTSGQYLYFDSDNDNFYETVYILENPIMEYDRTDFALEGTPVYRVKSVGYNYDGTHDFAPYKQVNREIITETDFTQLASETPKKFGSFWVVNFRKLRSNKLLFPDDPFDGYEAKDHIFEIYKLVDKSEFNSKFPELFYEVRHKSYSDAWSVYASQLARDTAEQVFMTLTASAVSGALQWIPFVGQVLGQLAYIGVYTLLTKFTMDLKRQKADAMSKAFTFSPVSLGKVKPKSLNERSVAAHGFWDDSTIATLIGHPNAYYTTVQGQAKGQTYTAQAIVSPHNLLRDNSAKNNKGFADFLWANTWNPGGADPDLMIGLDFDNINLDYFLLTSELPALNDDPDYTFRASAYNALYNQYEHNTLGYLQQEVAEASNSQLSLIKPIVIDGKPEYIFVDGNNEFNQLTMPASTLYQPIIVNSENKVRNVGTITVDIKTGYDINTKGISHQTSYPEKNKYASKIPLSSHSFEYPISSIKIELIEESITTGRPRTVESITFSHNSGMFKTEFGNLYFVDDIDTMIIADKAEYNRMINDGSLSSGATKYYKLTLKFDMIVPDSGSEKDTRTALTQATAYSIMDYMNQYTFAKTTADMVAEIAYTQTLTLISSAISAAATILGSWAVQGLSGSLGQAGVSISKQLLFMAGQFGYTVIMGSIKEMFEEIIIDGFLETWGEKFIKQMGGNDDQAFWFTSLLTSTREGLSGVRSVIQKGLGSSKIGTKLRERVNKHFGINQNSDTALQNEFIDLVNEANTDKKGKIKNEIDKIKSWKQIAGSGLLGLALSIVPAIFTGGMLFSNFFSTMGIANQIEGFFGDVIARAGTQLAVARMTGGNYKGDDLRKIVRPAKPKLDNLQIIEEFIAKNGIKMPGVDANNPRIINPMIKKMLSIAERMGVPLDSNSKDLDAKTFSKGYLKAKQESTKQNKRRLEGLRSEIMSLEDSSDIGLVAIPEDVEGIDLESDPVIEIDGIRYWIVPRKVQRRGASQTEWFNQETKGTLTFTKGTITLGTLYSILMLKEGGKIQFREKLSDGSYINHVLEEGHVVDEMLDDGTIVKTPLTEDMALSRVFDLIGYTHDMDSLRQQMVKNRDGYIVESLRVVYGEEKTFREKYTPREFPAKEFIEANKENYPNFVEFIKKWSSHFKGLPNLFEMVKSPEDIEIFEEMYTFIKQEAKTFTSSDGRLKAFNSKGEFDSTTFKNSFRSYFDMKYRGVDAIIANAIYDTIFKPGLDTELQSGDVTDQAEFLLLNIIMREEIEIHKSSDLSTVANDIKDLMEDPSFVYRILGFMSSSYAYNAFFQEFSGGFFDNVRTLLSFREGLSIYKGRVLEAIDALGLSPEELKNIPASEFEAIINGMNWGKVGNNPNSYLGLNEYIDTHSYKQLIQYILFNSDTSDIYTVLKASDRSFIDSITGILTKKVFRVSEQKHTSRPEGVSYWQKRDVANDLVRDAFMLVLIELTKLQNPEGNIELKDLRKLDLKATLGSINPANDLMEVVNNMGWIMDNRRIDKTSGVKNRFNQFVNEKDLKFPAVYTLLYAVADQLNEHLARKSQIEGMTHVLNLFASGVYKQNIEALAKEIFSDENQKMLTSEFFEVIENYFSENLLTFLQPSIDGTEYEISFGERISLLFKKLDGNGDPVKLKVGDLPDDIKVFTNGK